MKVINTPGMRARESSTSYNTKGNTVVAKKPTRMDQRAQEGKLDIIRREALPEEASIHASEMTTIKEI